MVMALVQHTADSYYGRMKVATESHSYTVLMLGDVFGQPGLDAVRTHLPALIADRQPDLVLANAENAAGGFGLTRECADELFACGIDVLTGGNHSWEKKGSRELLDSDSRILRPGNYPPGLPGSGVCRLEKAGVSWLVLNLQGRERMKPIDCPFRHADSILAGLDAPSTIGRPLCIVDIHAESFQEKEALALYLDGRVAVVAGTHTHVRTMDERILPQGTGYLGDLGMCGPLDSVIGVDAHTCVQRNLSQMPLKMESAQGQARLSGAVFTVDETGHCCSIDTFDYPPTV